MIRRPPRSTLDRSSAASDVYKRQHDDHRIAMACGVLALRAKGVVEVARPECVAKSYPEFFEELLSLIHISEPTRPY